MLRDDEIQALFDEVVAAAARSPISGQQQFIEKRRAAVATIRALIADALAQQGQERGRSGGVMRPAVELAVLDAPYRGDIKDIDAPDARWMAAADPTTVLGLLDRVKRLEAALRVVARGLKRGTVRAAPIIDMSDEKATTVPMTTLDAIVGEALNGSTT